MLLGWISDAVTGFDGSSPTGMAMATLGFLITLSSSSVTSDFELAPVLSIAAPGTLCVVWSFLFCISLTEILRMIDVKAMSFNFIEVG